MGTIVTIQPWGLAAPKWSKEAAAPGDTVELCVTVVGPPGEQRVAFEIRTQAHVLVARLDAKGSGEVKKKWVVPNTLAPEKLYFKALLRETPGPHNDHLTLRSSVECKWLRVTGFDVAVRAIDEAFAPREEKLQIAIEVTDREGAAQHGRVEIWGERYPGDRPLHVGTFAPRNGAVAFEWDGKATKGVLAGRYLSPEFTPYRARVIVAASPEAAGGGSAARRYVAVAEATFAVTFESVAIRLAASAPADTGALLAVYAPPASGGAPNALVPPNGRYLAYGRLPRPDEVARIRIPCVRFVSSGPSPWPQEPLNQACDAQGRHAVAAGYMESGPTKYEIDRPLYTRPEIPIEIVPAVRSRSAANNTPALGGVEAAAAVGSAIFDVHVEDVFVEELYDVTTPHGAYFHCAAHLVKDGRHDNPNPGGGVTYWQHRFCAPADDVRSVPFARRYAPNAGELTVYLNRTLLVRDSDYREPAADRIELAAGLVRRGDVVWIMRVPPAPTVNVAHWVRFPPGTNCHEHYGGLAGAPPAAGESRTKLLRSGHSAAPAGAEPILGKGPFPYEAHKTIDLDPDAVGIAKSERVEARAVAKAGDPCEGRAGILFSPSTVAGDCYRLVATLAAAPYERSFGFVESRSAAHRTGARAPWKQGATGVMAVTRVNTISASFKAPSTTTPGLRPGVGLDDAPQRANPGDGTGMSVTAYNASVAAAFNEWRVAGPLPAVHQDVPIATYVDAHNAAGAAIGGATFPTLSGPGDVTNDLVQWDYYRMRLPPDTPLHRLQVVSNAVARVPLGTPAHAAGAQVLAELAAHDAAQGAASPDVPGKPAGAPGHAPKIKAFAGGSSMDYAVWIKGIVKRAASEIFDAVNAQDHPARTMRVLRWPRYFQRAIWIGCRDDKQTGKKRFGEFGLLGTCRGSGHALFVTDVTPPNDAIVFEHEMGHSLHLCHFISGYPNNSCWKHHDHGYPSCKMSYPQKTYVVPGFAPGVMNEMSSGALGGFCAKCLLKLRGWNEVVLPCNWKDRNVF